MSDFERGKYYGKKKYNAQRSERSDPKAPYPRSYFNKTVYNPDKDTKEPDTETKPKVKQPQILIKTREKTEERSLSPKRNPKENEANTSHKDVVSSGTSEAQSSSSTKNMMKSVKFLEDGALCNDNIQDFLSESSDFLVVGVIGPQGVGKSTVMNLLASERVTEKLKKSLFKVPNKNDDDGIKLLSENMSKMSTDESIKDCVFKQATMEDIESCSSTTNGIDIFITDNRVILLDCQPYLSISIFDELMRSELKRSNVIGDFPPLENVGELQGLQHIAFLMSVCHVLILTQDYFFDSNNIRFLLAAEMLKPSISNNEEEYAEQFPHLLLVHNRAQMEEFSPARFKMLQRVYKQIFVGSKMHLESSMGLGTGKIIPSLNPDLCGDAINLFLLPEYNEDSETMYKGHPPFEELVKRLKMNINCVTKYPITHVQLTEKTWLVYCSKVWDHVKKSSFYVEYTKLMP